MSNRGRQSEKLRRVGALWKPKPGAKSLGFGELTIGDQKQRFLILRNDHKQPGSKQPDYVLMSSEEPEADDYTRRRADTDDGGNSGDDDIPF